MKLWKKIDKGLARIAIFVIKIYQYTLSPDKGIPSLWLKGRICMHEPHCSQYSIHVFARYGFFRGLFKVMDRVAQCTGGTQKIYDPAHYKVVFFSSAPIGVPFLKKLCEDNRYDVVGVVTQCDKPSGRGMNMCQNIIKTQANEIKKDENDFVYAPVKINPEKSEEGRKFAERLESKEPDFFVVIAYGKIIPQSILDIAKIAPINVHGSLLPRYRGASPLQSVFLNGDRQTGITIIKMDAGMDTGDMLDKKLIDIDFDRTVGDLIDNIKDIGPQFLNDVLWKYGKKMLGEVKQDQSKATYCNKIEKEDGVVDVYVDSIDDIYKKYRAFCIWPKIYFMFDSKRVIIEELKLDESVWEINKQNPLIDKQNKQNPCIKKILLKPEGKKVMEWKEFENGYLS